MRASLCPIGPSRNLAGGAPTRSTGRARPLDLPMDPDRVRGGAIGANKGTVTLGIGTFSVNPDGGKGTAGDGETDDGDEISSVGSLFERINGGLSNLAFPTPSEI